MRRRSERSKAKQSPSEESPEKSSRNSTGIRSSRRRKKSSSPENECKSPLKDGDVSQPLEIQVQDIELPQGENPAAASNNDDTAKHTESGKEWKEDTNFWQSETSQVAQESTKEETTKETEENSLWKVQSANGSGGGEIQKLKICRQKPTESPEIGETSLRKRLARSGKDNRSTDDSAHEESEKESKKSKHRSRTSSKNSPLLSPTVVCDVSGDSPTKIKIINVGHISTENKSENIVKLDNEKKENVEETTSTTIETVERSQSSQTLDIALPADQSETDKEAVDIPDPISEKAEPEKEVPIVEDKRQKDIGIKSSTKSRSPSPRPETALNKSKSSGSSDEDSDSSKGNMKQRKVKKKKRRDMQSTVKRRQSVGSSKQESSDSEDDIKKKKEADRRESTETKEDNTTTVNDKENEADNSLARKENTVDDSCDNKEKLSCPMPRKRRWGSSKANRPEKKPILTISTDSLKSLTIDTHKTSSPMLNFESLFNQQGQPTYRSLLPDAKPVPADELQLSVEEEEGQLDDDDEEDELAAMAAKEEEKQIERERQKEERQKEREKEMEERRKRQERFEKNKPEQAASDTTDKVAATRKILLMTDDAKKLARSPSPPRHKPTNVLYITHLVRPFTVQQLKNLLLRTGAIAENGFWIDKIKSKCYVEYTTEDAAVETRHALHGVRWPTSNPKTLIVEFASKDDLLMALTLSEEPEVPRKAEPLTMVEGWVAEQAKIKDRNRKTIVREWDVGKPAHPEETLEYDLKMREKEKKELERKARKERHHRSPTPETEPPARKSRKKDEEAPAKLLDDLFRKTKFSPCIYWLPLSPEQIAVKEEIRRKHMAEHERRMSELKKVEIARRDRERRNRK